VSGCTGVDVQPSPGNAELLRAAILCLVDRERASVGEQALRVDADLQQAAEGHTQSMAAKRYFEHDGPGGDTPLSRIQATGYLAGDRLGYDIGENIAWGTGYLGTPRSIVAAWMASQAHRENILDPHLRDTGIGVGTWTPAGTGGLYTQDFGAVYH
jgi:uncharacterized protein YkwD